MGKVAKIRISQEEAEAKAAAPQRPLTQKEQDQLAFRTGSRKQRRKIAKRNGFFRDKTGSAWRTANRMIREDNPEVRL